MPPGTILVPRTDTAAKLDQEIAAIATKLGVEVRSLELPFQEGSSYGQPPPRLGLYQRWQPVIDEGGTRFTLEEYGFPFTMRHDRGIIRECRKGGTGLR